jgi:PAS domain-containing protein
MNERQPIVGTPAASTAGVTGDHAAALADARSPQLAALLLASHRRLTGRELLPRQPTPAATAAALYEAPFVVLAHDDAADPCFIYANLAAQRRFDLALAEIIGLPSRHSAEPLARAERQRLLERVAALGFIDDYRGVRIDRRGRRFEIQQATVWNLIAADGRIVGQAAAFSAWTELPDRSG